MTSMINVYNNEVKNYQKKYKENSNLNVDEIITLDKAKISWNRGLKNDLIRAKSHIFQKTLINISLYRPFTKLYLYFDKNFNDMTYQIPKLFPTPDAKNKVICVTGLGTPKAFSVIMTNVIPDIQLQANGQCFPLYLYEESKTQAGHYHRTEAISDPAFTAVYRTIS